MSNKKPLNYWTDRIITWESSCMKYLSISLDRWFNSDLLQNLTLNQKPYLSTNSAPTISWMWYFMWNFTCEVVRRCSSSAFKTSPYLDFFTMPSTALRPDRKSSKMVRNKQFFQLARRCQKSTKLWNLHVTLLKQSIVETLFFSTPTLYKVLSEFAGVGNGKPPAACVPHSQDSWLHQLPAW